MANDQNSPSGSKQADSSEEEDKPWSTLEIVARYHESDAPSKFLGREVFWMSFAKRIIIQIEDLDKQIKIGDDNSSKEIITDVYFEEIDTNWIDVQPDEEKGWQNEGKPSNGEEETK